MKIIYNNEFNFEIKDIGLEYIAHFNCFAIKLLADSFSITISPNQLKDFIKLFPEINWEDGYMIHKLKGKYLRAVEAEWGRIVALKHIIKDITFELNGSKVDTD